MPRSKTPAAKDSATIQVRADPARQARFAKLRAELAQSEKREKQGWDRYYETLDEIVEAELYVYGGFDTAKAFIEAETGEKYRTAMRSMRVARFASPDDEINYGVAKIDGALAYLEAKTGGALKGRLPIALGALRFEVERDGQTRRVGLAEVTRPELVGATKALVGQGKATRTRRAPIELAAVQALGAHEALAQVTVRFRDGHFAFGGVPYAHLGAFLTALRGLPREGRGGVTPKPSATPKKKKPRATAAKRRK